MSGMWKRSHGRTSEAPPDERGGYRYVRPTATAPHLDSTLSRHPSTEPTTVGKIDRGRERLRVLAPGFCYRAAARLPPNSSSAAFNCAPGAFSAPNRSLSYVTTAFATCCSFGSVTTRSGVMPCPWIERPSRERPQEGG